MDTVVDMDEAVSGANGTDEKQKGKRPQLKRREFVQHIYLEHRLVDNACRFFIYLSMLCSLMFCLGTFDAIEMEGMVHQQLENMFEMDTLSTIKTPMQMMEYMQKFIKVSYDMSSALVDANTKDTMDLWRCFDANVNDICELKYWRLPAYDPREPEYVNTSQVASDMLSPDNHKPSVWDCPNNNVPNCINRSRALNRDYKRRTIGLTPEDPIIFKNKMDYPYISVAPLTPLVWQTLAKPAECSGFGNIYNDDVLGAGKCSSDTACDPQRVTSFNDEHPSLSGRVQTIFLTYEEHAFKCFDRSKRDSDMSDFVDKSWYPWATFDDMVKSGKKNGLRRDKDVLYKFISDVAYLQAPPSGLIYINFNDPCAPACEGASKNCADPMVDSEHPMWKEEKFLDPFAGCSMHKTFDKAFVDSPISSRINTFTTAQTTDLSIVTLVITPQMEGIPDIVTLVRVDFEVNQGGEMKGTKNLQSMSETLSWWKWSVFSTCLLALAFFVTDVKKLMLMRSWREIDGTIVLDIGVCTLTVVDVLMVFFVDLGTQSPNELLTIAFKENSESGYFNAFQEVKSQVETSEGMKQLGYFLILVQFFRLNHFLSLHPRLGILVEVLKECAQDLWHVMLLLTLLISVLAFLGFWYFGAERLGYRDMSSAMYSNFLMFVGEFDFPAASVVEITYLIYMITFVCVIFIVMLNFIMAVIVDAYEAVASVATTETNILTDVAQLSRIWIKSRTMKWPSTDAIWNYLSGTGHVKFSGTRVDQIVVDEDAPAVTADELFHKVVANQDPSRRLFTSLQAATEYVQYYLDVSSGDLEESAEHLLWPHATHYGSDPRDPNGLKVRTKAKGAAQVTLEHFTGAFSKVKVGLDAVLARVCLGEGSMDTEDRLDWLSPKFQLLSAEDLVQARAAAEKAWAEAEAAQGEDKRHKLTAAEEASERVRSAEEALSKEIAEMKAQVRLDGELLTALQARIVRAGRHAQEAGVFLREINTESSDTTTTV